MKRIYIIGGGTISHIRNHLALCAPAYGNTARTLHGMCAGTFPDMESNLYLTKMADSSSHLETNDDVANLIDDIVTNDMDAKVIFFNPALCDYYGQVLGSDRDEGTSSGKYEKRLKTSEGSQYLGIYPADKILNRIRVKGRKDIFLVAFKTTCGATEDEQYLAGLDLMKKNSCNLVLANDTKTRLNMIITPEEARYCVTTDRYDVLKELVDMTYLRSQLSFTRSTVVAGELVKWDSEEVFPALREIVNYCISNSAYKPFNGLTVGHFACKIGEKEFLTSVRKSNFNDLHKNGLVRIKTDGDDSVIAYGAKPSVGGQSQRIIFDENPNYDCIVHFHCPLRKGHPQGDHTDEIPVISQREYECGSHQCGQNTANGLQKFGNLSAVMLDNHGPNIVFNHDIDPQEVINFIEANFELSEKTGGMV